MTTSHLMARDQFPYWREVICQQVFSVDVTRSEEGPFRAEVESSPLGGLRVSRIFADPQHVACARHRGSLVGPELVKICVQTHGSSVVEQDGRMAQLAPGDLAMLDGSRSYRMFLNESFSHLVLHIPKQLLVPRFRNPEAITAVRFDGRVGRAALAVAFLEAVAAQLNTLDETCTPVVAEQAVALMALMLGGRSGGEETRDAVQQARLHRIHHYIEEHLPEPELTPAQLANAHRISLRYLHRLFERSGSSVGEWIRERRLQRCAGSLADPTQKDRSVSEIAFAWGFNDASHFSRAFKARFGLTPNEYRAAHMARPGDEAVSNPGSPPERPDRVGPRELPDPSPLPTAAIRT